MTEYAQILVLKDDVKRLELDKRLMAACHDVEMKEAAGEVARLKAEVERLRASSFVTAVPVEQYDRVIKAGDKLVEAIQEMDVIIDMDSEHPEVNAWNAAKEGKQP